MQAEPDQSAIASIGCCPDRIAARHLFGSVVLTPAESDTRIGRVYGDALELNSVEVGVDVGPGGPGGIGKTENAAIIPHDQKIVRVKGRRVMVHVGNHWAGRHARPGRATVGRTIHVHTARSTNCVDNRRVVLIGDQGLVVPALPAHVVRGRGYRCRGGPAVVGPHNAQNRAAGGICRLRINRV